MLASSGPSPGAIDNHVRKDPHVADVEHTVVRWSVRTGQPRTIHHEDHGQILQRDLLKDLIVATLQESAVNRNDRLQANLRVTGGKSNCVRFADPDIERIVLETLRALAPVCCLGTSQRS